MKAVRAALRFTRDLAAVGLAAGAGLVFPAVPASASTAALVDVAGAPCKLEPCSGTAETALVFRGGREANRVTLAAVAGGSISISDRGGVIEPGSGCSRVDERSVICSQPNASVLETRVFIATGGGADTVKSGAIPDVIVPGGGVSIDGGPGNDVLVGSPGADRLFGGSGADRLRGGAGDDHLHDASLRDFFPAQSLPVFPLATLPPGRARDSYDGGSGDDTVSYEGRAANLRINLASTRAIAGARGEHDSIRRVENAIAGRGNDRLAGDRNANLLQGQAGDDRLAGRRGRDLLSGQDGRDVISGGPGDDTINLESPSPASGGDRISCGSGDDSDGAALPQDLLEDDCEQISPANTSEAKVNVGWRSLLPLRKGREPRVLNGRLECAIEVVCQVRAELRVRGPASRHGTAPPRGTLLGAQSFTARGPGPFPGGAAGEQKTVDLRVSSEGLRLLRRHRALRVRVIIATQYSGTEPAGYLTFLRAP